MHLQHCYLVAKSGIRDERNGFTTSYLDHLDTSLTLEAWQSICKLSGFMFSDPEVMNMKCVEISQECVFCLLTNMKERKLRITKGIIRGKCGESLQPEVVTGSSVIHMQNHCARAQNVLWRFF